MLLLQRVPHGLLSAAHFLFVPLCSRVYRAPDRFKPDVEPLSVRRTAALLSDPFHAFDLFSARERGGGPESALHNPL